MAKSTSILITGAAGFIGYHVATRLLESGSAVVGLDNLNAYYDIGLKEARLALLQKYPRFSFERMDLCDASLGGVFSEHAVSRVIHLAAQAGVRYSLTNPEAYIQSNLVAFSRLLECCRKHAVEHFVYASSSSVYGGNTKVPFSVHDNVDHPVSLYAATKKSNELMAHSYAHLFRLPCTGLRFFTVYGPWGRPDMAAFLFCKAMLEGKPIDLFNEGFMRRDFTYVEDIAEGVARVLDRVPQPDPLWDGANPDSASSTAPYRIYNIGNHEPVELLRFVEILEVILGRKAEKRLLPMQAGDVPETFASVEELARDTGFSPSTPIETGLRKFVEWYRGYYNA